LQGAPRQSQNFHHAISSVVPPDPHVRQSFLIGQFADLKRIPRGQDDTVAASFQFPDYWDEKRNVRRIVEIDPNRHSQRGGGITLIRF